MPPPKKKEGGTETDKVSLLILRRKGGHGEHGHHGGAWKIAYADFVTAMMAFFLLMWLLNSTNKSDKQGIADFFNRPLAVAFDHGNSSSASASIINGGGADIMSRTAAEVAHGDDSKKQNAVLVPNATSQRSADEQDAASPGMVMPATDPVTGKPVPTASDPDDAPRLKALKDRLDKMIQMNAKLAQFKDQIKIDITSEGLRIQIVDAQNRPMFQSGRAELEPYAKEILDQIGLALNDVPNRVSVAGHTDSAPYAGALSGYSNWELSSERANSARRELGIGGMKELKVLQVRGLADSLPLERNDPAAPINRRISIVVLNQKTEQSFYRDGGRMDLDTPGAKPADAPKTTAATAAPASHLDGSASNRGSSPTGDSPDNRAASPEAVVARIKAAVDVADPAPSAHGTQKHGSPAQDTGVSAAPVKTSLNSTTGSSSGGSLGSATGGISPQAAVSGGSITTPAKPGTVSTPIQKIAAAPTSAPAQKVSSGAIQPAPGAKQDQVSDFGRAQ